MEDQQSDCPCKKQRVLDTEEDSIGIDEKGTNDHGGGDELPNSDQMFNLDQMPSLDQMPNLDLETGNDAKSTCSGGGLLECLTRPSSLAVSTCTDSDTGEIIEKSSVMPVDKETENKPQASQRVRHDIARVLQDTMAALAENTYIRNKEAGLQAMNIDSSFAKFERVNPVRQPDIEHDESPGHDLNVTRGDGVKGIRCQDDRYNTDMINDVKVNCFDVGNDSEAFSAKEGSEFDESSQYKSRAEKSSPELPSTSSAGDGNLIRNDEYGTGLNVIDNGERVKDKLESSNCEDINVMDDDDDDDFLHYNNGEGFLSDSGFINLFSNCRNPTTSHYNRGDSVSAMQEHKHDKHVETDTTDIYRHVSGIHVNAAGDASVVQQGSMPRSSDSSPLGELKIKSLILDSFFKYIPCGNTSKHEILCRHPNTLFQLDVDYVHKIMNQNNINSLPPQILVQIFRYLNPFTLLRRVSLVCKYWYNWCRDQDLWRHVNLMNQHKLTDVHLQQLISFSDRVISVNLTDCRFVTNVGVKILLARCRHLQVLKLMRCFDLSDESFNEIYDKKLCSQLRCLRLDGCCKITDSTIIKVAKACPLLQILHINTCTKITDNSIKVLADHCPRLTQLLMDHCSQVTEEGLEAIVRGCPYMSYLNIMSCGVTDRGVKLLAKLTHLTNVDLSNIPRLTPDAIIYLSRHCKNLECINISLNSVMNDLCVTELARNLTNLKRLYCVSCNISDTGLEKIAEYRPSLEALDVGWCQDITDHGVRVISNTCPRLDYFGLIRCDQVSVETVEELVLKFPKVNYSTFVLESRRLLERAEREGFLFGLPAD